MGLITLPVVFSPELDLTIAKQELLFKTITQEINGNLDADNLNLTDYAANLTMANAAGPAVLNEAATATNPTLIPNKAELDTGFGWAAADTLTAITGGSERLRIHSDGKVSVGTSSLAGMFNVSQSTTSTILTLENTHASGPLGVRMNFTGASPDDNLQYFLRFDDSTAIRCLVYSDGDLANHDGTYGTISDVKFKQDIQAARSYWDDFKALPYKKWRDKDDVAANSGAPYRLGLVAQDVEEIFPSLAPDAEDFKWVKSSIIEGPIMATVVQELQRRVELLEAA